MYGSTVAVWHFDENAGTTVYDKTVYNNHGTLITPAFTSDSINGYALDFNGAGDYIDLGDGKGLDVGEYKSISAWIKLDTVSGAQAIIGDMGANDNRGWLFRVINDELDFGGSNNGSDEGLSYRATTNANLAINTWYHVVVVKNNTKAYFYVNGDLKTDDSGVIHSSYYDAVMTKKIGCYGGGCWTPFSGIIDELSVYNKPLTEREVDDLYNSQVARYKDYMEGYNNKGRSLWLDGHNTFVNASAHSSLDCQSDCTLSAWIKTYSSMSTQAIIDRYGSWWAGANKASYRLFIDSGYLKIDIRDDLDDASQTISSTDTISTSEWHHVVGVKDKTNTELRLYIDGEEAATTTLTETSTFNNWNNAPVSIGAKHQYNVEDWHLHFQGLIDEVRVYNRALSINEVKNLYTESHGRLDYADLRFTDLEGKELHYYFECDNLTWVNVTSVPALSSVNITMYYNNTKAESTSDGSRTFLVFDDFNSGVEKESLSNTIWPYQNNGFEYDVDFGRRVVKYNGGGGVSRPRAISANQVSGNLIIDGVVRSNAGINTHLGFFSTNDISSAYGYFYHLGWADTGTDAKILKKEGSTAPGIAETPNSVPTSYRHIKGTYINQAITFYYQDSNFIAGSDSTYTSGRVLIGSGSSYPSCYWDWIRVREYVSTEPTVTKQASEYQSIYSCCGDDGLNDYFTNTTTTCYWGCTDVDDSQYSCENTGNEWLNGSVTGNNTACCGDDGVFDDFYNNTIGISDYFCSKGELVNQEIDFNQTICEYWNNTWFTGISTGNNASCCGDDESLDYFGNNTHCCSYGVFTSGSCPFSPAGCLSEHIDLNEDYEWSTWPSDDCGLANCTDFAAVDEDVDYVWDGYCYNGALNTSCISSNLPPFNTSFTVTVKGNLTEIGTELPVVGETITINANGADYEDVTDSYGGWSVEVSYWEMDCATSNTVIAEFSKDDREYTVSEAFTAVK